MTADTEPPHRARGRNIHEEHRVATPLELLFDLFFVVAIALAAAQLHHGVMDHHAGSALAGFLAAFMAIWWAWMNYSWFASAYDNDDAVFRLLTMVQMAGVLIFSTGIAGIFKGEFTTGVVGYAVMRLGLVALWLRTARDDPPRRATCLRYAFGIAAIQVLWIARLWAPSEWTWPGFVVLMALELALPMWAEKLGATPWHAHHIAERYGLLTIIVLGECVLGATNAVAGVLRTHGWSLDVALVGLGSAALVLSLWWVYFLLPSADALHHHRERSFVWGYGHYFVFASLAALGAGLEVVADVFAAGSAAADAAAHGVSAVQAIGMVALAETVFIVSVWAVYVHATHARGRQRRLVGVALACIAAVVAATAAGLPAAWALPALAIGPTIAIVFNERGRRRRQEDFAVR